MEGCILFPISWSLFIVLSSGACPRFSSFSGMISQITYSSSTYLRYKFRSCSSSFTFSMKTLSHQHIKRDAISPAAFTPIAPPFACFLISSLNLKMWFFSTVFIATPIAYATTRFNSSPSGFSRGLIQAFHLSTSFSFIPQPVIVGSFPFLFLVALYFVRSALASSSLSTVSARYRPSSSALMLSNDVSLSVIMSTHFSVAKSISIDG